MNLPPRRTPRPFSPHFNNYNPRGPILTFDTPATWFCRTCGAARERAGDTKSGKVPLTCGHKANEVGDSCANVV